MSRLPTLLRIALREMRGGRTGGRVRGFRIFLLCLLLGVAIVAGVGSIAACDRCRHRRRRQAHPRRRL